MQDEPINVLVPEVVVVYEVPGGVQIVDVDSITEISMGVVAQERQSQAQT